MRKPCWLIQIPGYRPFSMVGETMNRAEALRCAQLIWPNAEVC